MNMPVSARRMTSLELLQLPEDGVERYLIDGQLREAGDGSDSMTRRNRRHSRATVKLAKWLDLWLDQQPLPRGEILGGDAAFRLRQNPDTTVGIDLAYVSAALANQTAEDTFLMEGAPILAVEILSPSDKHEDVVEKLQTYLACGVAVVWVVDPDLRTVTVHRPGTEPELVNMRQELSGEPELPGFRVSVAQIFQR